MVILIDNIVVGMISCLAIIVASHNSSNVTYHIYVPTTSTTCRKNVLDQKRSYIHMGLVFYVDYVASFWNVHSYTTYEHSCLK